MISNQSITQVLLTTELRLMSKFDSDRLHSREPNQRSGKKLDGKCTEGFSHQLWI